MTNGETMIKEWLEGEGVGGRRCWREEGLEGGWLGGRREDGWGLEGEVKGKDRQPNQRKRMGEREGREGREKR